MCFITDWIKRLFIKGNWWEIEVLLKEAFPQATIYLSDENYGLVNLKRLKAFLKEDKTDLMNFLPDARDCDDFSFRLMGQFHKQGCGFEDKAVGIIWCSKPAHALNIAILEDKSVVLIEPQSDRIYSKPENYVGYLIVI